MLCQKCLLGILSFFIAAAICHDCLSTELQTNQSLPQSNFDPSAEQDPPTNVEGSYFDQAKPPRRPPVGFQAEWIGDSQFGLATAKVDTTLPLLMFGTPPPLVKVGFSYTDLFAAESFGLPANLYEYSVGLAWVRPINDRWTVRTMLGVGLATDNENNSSDGWQFRGGVFAMLKRSEQLTWTFGGVATGRDDLPVIPAVGAVWMPNPCTRVDLLFPQPRINRLIIDDGSRQQWAYFGFGINGKTWGYEQPGMIDDRLTYKDVRMVVGWEARPAASAGLPFAIGRTTKLELGYVFSREFKFENETRVEALSDGLMLGVTTKF